MVNIQDLDKRVQYLLNNETKTNCFQAVLYVTGLTEEFRLFGEGEFLNILRKNCQLIAPGMPTQKGNIICMTYGEDRCQHAFLRWNDDKTVFQRQGPDPDHKHEIVSLTDALMGYYVKLTALLIESGDETIKNLMLLSPRILCFRVKS